MADVNILGSQLSKNRLQEILETTKVDVGNGTLFGVATRRAPAQERLTLVISSGGSGMSAIKSAMRIADQKLEEEYKTFVKFIVVDSSSGELSPFSKMDSHVIKNLNISAPGARDRFKYDNRSAFFKGIIPRDYDVAGLINEHGASQDRMTGRIKLYDIHEGEGNDTRLKRIINNLFATEWTAHKNKPVDIILLTGISGGNGSGTFMDLAVIAKNACPDQSKVKVYGYMMLPDTAEGFAEGDQAKGTLYRNGFAALKELESYMSMIYEPERKEKFPSTRQGEEIEVSSLNLPFDYPVLISGNYDDAVSMIGETIVNLIADSEGQFDQKAFYSNLVVMRNNALAVNAVSDLGILKAGTYPEDSRMYCGIGYAHASIPEKIVVPNVIGKVCRKLSVSDNVSGMDAENAAEAFCSNEKPLTSAQFERAIRTLFALEGEVHSKSLWNKIKGIMESTGRVPENEFVVTKADIMADNVEEYLGGFNVDDTALKANDQMTEELNRLQREFKINAQRVMGMYGPRAMQFLYDGKGYFTENGGREDLSRISIQTLLSNVQMELQKMASTPGEYPPRLAKESNPLKALWEFFTHNNVNDWMGQAAEAAQTDIFCKVAKTLGGGTWKQEYENIVLSFLSSCIRFADVLDVMTDHYEGAGKVLDEGYEKFSVETGEKNGINLCQSQKMYTWVKEKVNQKIANVDIKTVKQALIDDFMAHREEWISEEDGKARKRYDEVMSMSCKIGRYATVEDGLHLSVSDYFEEILEDVQDVSMQVTKIQNELSVVIGNLRQASAPSLHIERDAGVHVNENILVPKELFAGPMGTVISSAFAAVVGGAKVHQSSVVDSIVCYQTSVANPISALKDLTRWEMGYENNYGSEASATCHSCNGEHVNPYTELSGTETDADRGEQLISPDIDAEYNMLAETGLSWKHYPSINTKIYGDNFQKSEVSGIGKTIESDYRVNVFDKKIEYALREGIIECVKNGNQYTYFLNVIPADWTNLSAASYVADERSLEKGKFKRGQELFKYLAAQNPHSQHNWRYQIKLLGSAFFERPFDFAEILRKEHWKPERVNATHKAYMKRIMRKNIFLYRNLEETLYRYDSIRRTLEEGEVQYKEQYQMNLFIDLFQYGLIYSDAKDQVWNVRINEAGANKPIIVFNQKLTATLKGMERGLDRDKLHLALVYCRFVQMAAKGEIDLDELDALKDEIINGMTEEEFTQTRDENLARLNVFYAVYGKKYANAKDQEKAMADAWLLKGGERNDVKLVSKLYWEIQQVLEMNGYDIESEPVVEEESADNMSEAAETWTCPACGGKHALSVKFCPNDGTQQPPRVVPQSENWICPTCGAEHARSVKFCPNDGTPQPVKEEGWICPVCGTKHADTVMFCPNDGTKKPDKQEKTEGWICPVCGTKHADTVMFCPNDGTKNPGGAAPAPVPTEWFCPACGTKHPYSVMFCPNDGTKRV